MGFGAPAFGKQGVFLDITSAPEQYWLKYLTQRDLSKRLERNRGKLKKAVPLLMREVAHTGQDAYQLQ